MGFDILVVDDKEQFAVLVKKILEKRGYNVTVANSGKECLKILETIEPDLILSDIMMPDMDGWELCKRIKSNPKLYEIPIAIVSVKSSNEDIKKSIKEYGALWHFTKPLDYNKFLSTVEFVLKNYKEKKRLLKENEGLKSEINKLKGKIEYEGEEYIRDKAHMVKNLVRGKSTSKSEVTEKSGEETNLKEEVLRLNEKIQNQTDDIKDLQNKLDKKEADYLDLSEELENEKFRNKKLEKEMKNIKIQMGDIFSMLDEKNRLMGIVKEKIDKKKGWEEEIANLEEKIGDIETKIVKYKGSL